MKLSVCMAALMCGAQFVVNPAIALASVDEFDVVEVVVTGEKTRRSLQETHSSVAVVASQRIDAENIQTLHDVINRTANMSETLGQTGFTIRGISNLNVSGGGAGALATVYVDGAALPNRAIFAGPLNMWDVGQVEIFRGPQSTIQGKNALAGAIVIRSKDPTFTYEAQGRLLISDQDESTLGFALGGPLIDDQVAFRLSAEKRASDGYIYNTTRDDFEAPYDGASARAKLLIRPAALPDLDVTATYSHHAATAGYMYGYARTDTPDYYSNPISTANRTNTTQNTTDIFTIEANYTLSDSWGLTGILSYNRFDNQLDYDLDNTEFDDSYGSQSLLAKTSSQELHLNYKGSRFNALFGFYRSERDTLINSQVRTHVTTPVDTIIGGLVWSGFDLDTAAFVADLYAAALPLIPIGSQAVSTEAVENTAVFADGTFQITPRLSLFGGLRYDRETYGISLFQDIAFDGNYPDPANYPEELQPAIWGINALVDDAITTANAGAPAQPRTFEAWLPKLGIQYAFDASRSLSFTTQRGYRSGGSAVNLARSTVVAYDPEYTTNYELAWRSAWMDNRLIINANAYYIDWTDQQVDVFMGLNEYDYETKNAGSSHLYGFEVEVAQRVNSRFDWYASLGHARTQFDDFVVAQGILFPDFSGNEFGYAPRWTAAAGGTYRANNGVFANVNANFRGEGYQEADNAVRLKSRTLVNTKVGYEARRWAAYLYANNLTGAKYRQFYRPDVQLAMLGAPRTFGVILEARY